MQIPLELRSERWSWGQQGRELCMESRRREQASNSVPFPLESDWNVPVRDREELEPGEKASLMIRGPQRTMSPSAGILQDLVLEEKSLPP